MSIGERNGEAKEEEQIKLAQESARVTARFEEAFQWRRGRWEGEKGRGRRRKGRRGVFLRYRTWNQPLSRDLDDVLIFLRFG